MRRTILRRELSLLSVVLVTLIATVASGASVGEVEAQVPPPGHCQATLVIGLARIQRGGEEPGVRLMRGMTIQAGDVLMTLGGARVELKLSGGTVARVGEKTLFTVEAVAANELLASAEAMETTGEAHVWVRTADRMREETPEVAVRTPVVLTAVRGTVFDLSLMGEMSARVRCFKGATNVTPIAMEEKTTLGAEPARTSMAPPTPIRGPVPIAGPREVTLREFTVLVEAMQEVTFTQESLHSQPETRAFDQEEAEEDEWVQWNLALDDDSGSREYEY